MSRDDSGSVPGGWRAPFDQVLARYVSGTATAVERETVEVRMRSDAGVRGEVERLRIIWEQAAASVPSPVAGEEIDRAWQRFVAAARIAEVEGGSTYRRGADRSVASGEAQPASRARAEHPRLGRSLSPPPGPRRWRRLAYAVSGFIAVVATVWTARVTTPEPEEAVRVATAAREYIASAGTPLAVDLADGTRVTLAPGSRLTTGSPVDHDRREVTLTGRAYFAVAHDASRPFLVHAAGTVTRVLGTEFDVRAYPGVPAQVAVNSGRVEVRALSRDPSEARALTRGERATIDPLGSVDVEAAVDLDALLAWTQGRLVFRGAALREVVPELEGWLDVEIRVTDSILSARRITATFEGESPDVVLSAVAELVGARIERAGRQVVLVPFRSR